jgi:hypothetical protein
MMAACSTNNITATTPAKRIANARHVLLVSMTQVAPTILKSLNVNPTLLQSVAAGGTQVLPGLGF